MLNKELIGLLSDLEGGLDISVEDAYGTLYEIKSVSHADGCVKVVISESEAECTYGDLLRRVNEMLTGEEKIDVEEALNAKEVFDKDLFDDWVLKTLNVK